MIRQKLPLLGGTLAVFVATLLGAAPGNAESQPSNKLCTHQFALCTSAPCVPLPGDASKAICFCDVEEGKSMSTAACETIEPRTDANGIRTVYSTFSLDQFGDGKKGKKGKKGMKCPSGTPWTWCLNKPCTVNPADPKHAICTCDVVRTGEWMTLGGACDAATCKTSYWSAAPMADFESGNEFMTKALGLPASPATWCPADAR